MTESPSTGSGGSLRSFVLTALLYIKRTCARIMLKQKIFTFINLYIPTSSSAGTSLPTSVAERKSRTDWLHLPSSTRLDRPGGAVSETCGFWDVNPQLQGAFCHNRLKIGHTERASEREEDQDYKKILLIGGEMVEP